MIGRAWVAVLWSCAFAAGLAGGAMGQAPALPRTPDGHPDFQGVWSGLWVAPLERPAGMPLRLSRAEAEAFASAGQPKPGSPSASEETPFFGPELRAPLVVRGEYRSSLIIEPADGRIPYTEAGRRRLAAAAPVSADGPEGRNLAERCLSTNTLPIAPRVVGNFRQIVQTRDSLVIATDYSPEVRIIPLDGRRPPMIVRAGVSSGRWDGDTLVVETTGFRADEPVRTVVAGQFAISPQTRITERFALVSAAEIAYTFTIEDAALYAQPWTGESVFRRDGVRIYEFACHEGNYSMKGILGGARVVEKRAAAKAAKTKGRR